MSISIYKVNYEFISGVIRDEMEFIDAVVDLSDDGTHYIEEEDLKEIKSRQAEYEKTYGIELKDLISAFEIGIKSGGGSFSFQIF
jgi:replication-associated recombination protein RarA